MLKTIKIEFKILASYYEDDPYKQEHKNYNVEEEFSENITFKEMLEIIYNKYSLIKEPNGFHYFINNLNEAIWGNIFDKEIYSNIYYITIDYYDLTLKQLEQQFEISKSIFDIWLDPDGIGDTVGEFEGIKFYFHMNETDRHHEPHIHCKYAGQETRINLKTLEIMDEPFKKSKMDKALELIKRNQIRLIKYWDDKVVNGESIKFQMELYDE